VNGIWQSTDPAKYMFIDYADAFALNDQFIETHFVKDALFDPRNYFKFGPDPKNSTKIRFCMTKMVDRDVSLSAILSDLQLH
jgi:hypothetical protein